MKLEVERIRIDRGGYSLNYVRGSYFGHGQPLYVVRGEDDKRFIEEVVRASSAREARMKVAKDHGVNATFPRKKSDKPRRRPRSRALLLRADRAMEHAQEIWSRAVDLMYPKRGGGPYYEVVRKAYPLQAKREAERARDAFEVAADAYEEYGDLKRSKKALERALNAEGDRNTTWVNPRAIELRRRISGLSQDIKAGRRDVTRPRRRYKHERRT